MAYTLTQLHKIFGDFSYTDDTRRKGAVVIDPAWVNTNITHIATQFGRFPCHRLVAEQMKAFVKAGISSGLINDIGGIWVPRHILWDPARPLSGHAFGCDIDINVDDGLDGPGGVINYGTNSYQPPRLCSLAVDYGFEWGGTWRHGTDGMHFSCIRVADRGTSNERAARSYPDIAYGARGPAVGQLQQYLNAQGYHLTVDGIFGPKTEAALTDWQRLNHLKSTGTVDQNIWRLLKK